MSAGWVPGSPVCPPWRVGRRQRAFPTPKGTAADCLLGPTIGPGTASSGASRRADSSLLSPRQAARPAGSAGRSPRGPGSTGSSTRSPPIPRMRARDTYSPSPLPLPLVRPAAPRSNRPNSQARSDSSSPWPWSAIVVHRRPRLGVGADRDVDRAPAVLDGVVEQRPEHLVELVAVGDGEPVRSLVAERQRPVPDRERVPGALDPRRDRQDVRGRPGRLRLEPADEEQLLDHPGQPVRLLGDDRQARDRRSVAAERVGVRLGSRSAASGGCG